MTKELITQEQVDILKEPLYAEITSFFVNKIEKNEEIYLEDCQLNMIDEGMVSMVGVSYENGKIYIITDQETDQENCIGYPLSDFYLEELIRFLDFLINNHDSWLRKDKLK